MAKFESFVPYELIKQMEDLAKNTPKMQDEMLLAAADGVMKRIESHAPAQIKNNEDIMKGLRITRLYDTSDRARNIKVGFWGYYEHIDDNGKKVKTPIPLIANLFEYGTSKGSYPKKPFMRRSFAKARIEEDMLKAQEKYIKE